MGNKKQKLAVEWFARQLYLHLKISGSGEVFDDLLEQAKEKEVTHVEEGYLAGAYGVHTDARTYIGKVFDV
jgi:hypothetical protein